MHLLYLRQHPPAEHPCGADAGQGNAARSSKQQLGRSIGQGVSARARPQHCSAPDRPVKLRPGEPIGGKGAESRSSMVEPQKNFEAVHAPRIVPMGRSCHCRAGSVHTAPGFGACSGRCFGAGSGEVPGDARGPTGESVAGPAPVPTLWDTSAQCGPTSHSRQQRVGTCAAQRRKTPRKRRKGAEKRRANAGGTPEGRRKEPNRSQERQDPESGPCSR